MMGSGLGLDRRAPRNLSLVGAEPSPCGRAYDSRVPRDDSTSMGARSTRVRGRYNDPAGSFPADDRRRDGVAFSSRVVASRPRTRRRATETLDEVGTLHAGSANSADVAGPHLAALAVEAAALVGVVLAAASVLPILLIGGVVAAAFLLRASNRGQRSRSGDGFLRYFGSGFLPYDDRVPWPRGVQEDDDFRWHWTE